MNNNYTQDGSAFTSASASASTTCYNRAYDEYDINDLYTPEKIIDRFGLELSGNECGTNTCGDGEEILVAINNGVNGPSTTTSIRRLQYVEEHLPESLQEYNVSPNEWSQFRNQLLPFVAIENTCRVISIILAVSTVIPFLVLMMFSGGKYSTEPILDPKEVFGEVWAERIPVIIGVYIWICILVGIFGSPLFLCYNRMLIHRICQTTTLLVTTPNNKNIRVRFTKLGDVTTCIEIYIPATFRTTIT